MRLVMGAPIDYGGGGAAGPLLVLAAGELHAVLAPSAGGSIAAFSRRWRDGRRRRELHWLRPATASDLADRNPLGMASFPLLPFCNRIRDGRARFEGREIRCPPNHPGEDSPHPLHGIGWLRPWTVEAAGPREAQIRLQVEAGSAWPWRFSAHQRFTLDEHGLSVEIAVRNEDDAAMPLGIGHHPYFPHHPGTRLATATQAVWLTDGEVMPTQLARAEPVEALIRGIELGRLDLDNNFTGWSRRALIEWPADVHGPARSLALEAEPPLDHFVLYCPRGQEHFCAEPVSQCTDWLNLAPRFGPDALGGARLAPGDSLVARFTLQPDWA